MEPPSRRLPTNACKTVSVCGTAILPTCIWSNALPVTPRPGLERQPSASHVQLVHLPDTKRAAAACSLLSDNGVPQDSNSEGAGHQDQRSKETQNETRWLAGRFIMVEASEARLFWKEVDGRPAACICDDEVERILRFLHDTNGYLAWRTTAGRCYGGYYWPRRDRDTRRWAASCEACQRV